LTTKFSISKKCSLIFDDYKGKIILYAGSDLLFDGFSTGYKFINLPLLCSYTLILDNGFSPKFDKWKEINFPFQLPKKDYDKTRESKLSYDPNNFSPASIEINSAEIFVNDTFLNLPFYAQSFILFHETGHLKYDGEFEADIYAIKKAIENGIALSMCVKTHEYILSNEGENRERKEFVLDIVEKINETIKIN
jgi:hypothetical protein